MSAGSSFKIVNLLFSGTRAYPCFIVYTTQAGFTILSPNATLSSSLELSNPCTFLSLKLVTSKLKVKKAPHLQVLVHPFISDGFNHNLLINFTVVILQPFAKRLAVPDLDDLKTN